MIKIKILIFNISCIQLKKYYYKFFFYIDYIYNVYVSEIKSQTF